MEIRDDGENTLHTYYVGVVRLEVEGCVGLVFCEPSAGEKREVILRI